MRNIQDALAEHKRAVIEYGIPENQIMGIFVYGSQNYGINLEDSDVDTKAIYIPTIEAAILDKAPLVKELHLANGEHCELMDIRHLVDNFRKQNINFIEILYTQYYWINPLYNALWFEHFVERRDIIAHYDVKRGVESIVGQALHTLGQNRYNGKKVANVWRLTDFLDKYIHGVNYKDCLVMPTGTTVALKLLKSRLEPLTSDELQTQLELTLIKIRDDIRNDNIHLAEYGKDSIDIAMNNGIIALIRREDAHE